MTPDESDLRLRGIHDEWQRWCKGPGATVSFVSTPMAGLAMNPSTARPRRIELVRRGLVVEAGTRKAMSGRYATAWRLA